MQKHGLLKNRNFATAKRKNDIARLIKEPPILYGEDAQRFEARMKERRYISSAERARIKANYEAGMAMLERGMRRKHAANV